MLNQARAAGLNVSRLAAAALAEELDRRAKINELVAYLADLDNELGPVPQHELKAAREWADAILPRASQDEPGLASTPARVTVTRRRTAASDGRPPAALSALRQ